MIKHDCTDYGLMVGRVISVGEEFEKTLSELFV